MRITTRISWDIETWEVLEHEFYEYDGPVARCDRAAQGEAKQAEKNAQSVAGQEETSATAAQNQLFPFFRQEMNAQHGFTPGQLQTFTAAAEAPLASSAATTAGKAESEAARTRNASGFSSALDQAARDRNAALGQAGENIASQDIMEAKKLNQEGATGMSGLFNTDTEAMLKAMGQEAPDINAQTDAGKSGWFQNTLAGINTAANLLKSVKPGGF